MRSRRALPVLAAIVLSAPPAGAAETTGELPHYTLRVELHPAAQELVVEPVDLATQRLDVRHQPSTGR